MSLSDLARPEDNEVLKDIIVGRIAEAGHLTFAEFMDLALYHPELGYYRTCDPALDFQTSPQVHPVFGAAIAGTLADMWRCLDRPSRFQVFEAGAGTGQLCGDILRWLRANEPDLFSSLEYTVCDPRIGARDELRGTLGDVAEVVTVANDLPPPGSVLGCILSNELFDALPFHRVAGEGVGYSELFVTAAGRELQWESAPPSAPVRAYFDSQGVAPAPGCSAEANLNASAWAAAAAACLARGYALTFDYGYQAAELYAPWRKTGTMLTFHRMMSGEDPLLRVGRQDITASIDFTAIQDVGRASGVSTLGFTSQAEFLALAAPVGAPGPEVARSNMEGFLALRRALQVLSDPAQLGRIRVLLQGRDVGPKLPAGFEVGG